MQGGTTDPTAPDRVNVEALSGANKSRPAHSTKASHGLLSASVSGTFTGMSGFFRRVKDRKVVQWALAYLAGAWLLLQVTSVVGSGFAWPPIVLRSLTVVLGIGFLGALVVAWYHGEKGAQRVSVLEVLLLAGILVLAAAAVALVRPEAELPASTTMHGAANTGGAAAEASRSIVVLPFVNTSADTENEYFSDGITEELLGALAGVDGLRVASRTSSFAFKGRDLPVQEIGRALNVASVVEGSVRKAGDQIRITARLTDARADEQLWSASYTRDLRDIFEVQEEIAREVVLALRGHLLGDDERIVDRPTNDIGAYDAYLRGRYLWHRRTRQSLLAAREQFRAAVRREPGFARAHLGLADAYAVMGFYDQIPPTEAFPAAQAAAQTALELDPQLAGAHATLGYVALYHDWDWSRAETEFRTAIAMDPRYSVAHQWLANYLVAMGRFDEAIASMRRALELDPLSLIASAALGWAHHFAGNQEAALDQYRRTLELEPGFQLAHLWNGLALLEADQPRTALRSIRRAVQLAPDDPLIVATLAFAQARAGATADALDLLAWLEAREQRQHTPSYEIAKVHLALGDRDAALTWLERAFRERSHSIAFLAVDPGLAPLHGDPAYRDLVRRADLEPVLGRAADPPRP